MFTEGHLSAAELEARLRGFIQSSETGEARGALARTLSELAHVGHPPLIKASRRLLSAEGLTLRPELESALRKVCSGRAPARGACERHYAYIEEELLLDQLKELLRSLAIDRHMKLLSPLAWLREELWSEVIMGWVERLEGAREQGGLRRELGLVINASDELGMLLEYDPFRFADEGVDILADHLRALELGGGEVSVLLPEEADAEGWEALRASGLLHDLRGVERLSVDGHKLLSLLEREELRGLEQLKELAPLVLSDDELAQLAEGPLLEVVYAGVKRRPARGAPSEALASRLKGARVEALRVAERCCARLRSEVGGVVFYERVIPGGVSRRGERVAPLLMMETPVTQALYQAVMGANPSRYRGPNKPVEQVSCVDGALLSNALSEALGLTRVYEGDPHQARMNKGSAGFRLPFEAEWVQAARGGEPHPYAGSRRLSEVGWSALNSGGVSHDVALLRPNGYGLYDMSGGVFEWLSDEHFTPGRYDPEATMRAYRGGSWDSRPERCELESRSGNAVDRRAPFVGLRLCRALD